MKCLKLACRPEIWDGKGSGYQCVLFHGLCHRIPTVPSGTPTYARNTFREGSIRRGSYLFGDILESGLAERLVRLTTARAEPVPREFRFELDYTSSEVWDYWNHTPPHEVEGQWLPLHDWMVFEDRRHFPEPKVEPTMEICGFRPWTIGELSAEDRRETRYRQHAFMASDELKLTRVPRDERVVETHGIISGGGNWFVADRIVPLLEPYVIEPYLFWFDFEEL